MWKFFDDRVLFLPDGSLEFDLIPLALAQYQFHGSLIKIPFPDRTYRGFDDWREHFPREEELSLVQSTLARAKENSAYRGHIQGISLAESVELLREYYKDL
jgi:hypothetical protein